MGLVVRGRVSPPVTASWKSSTSAVVNETVEVAFDLEAEIRQIAAVCRVPEAKARPAALLLVEGDTIPFIARYRKERTGGLDEAALRAIEDAIQYFRELAERKATVLKTIHEQKGKR